MKRIAMLLVALLAMGAGLAQAQINADMLMRVKGQLADAEGNVLSDAEVLDLIGAQIYNETYVGATKQYNAGKQLIAWGIVGSGAGLLSAMIGGVIYALGANEGNYTLAQLGGITLYGGALLMSVGSSLLAAGIPLNVIGKSRLNWIADDYNGKQEPPVTLRLTGCSAGTGLGLAIVF